MRDYATGILRSYFTNLKTLYWVEKVNLVFFVFEKALMAYFPIRGKLIFVEGYDSLLTN